MTRPPFEVADILRTYQSDYRKAYPVSFAQNRVMQRLIQCRTEALGGHMEKCNKCSFEHPAYDSCRDRHCTKCQGIARAKWLETRMAELLPVKYFHVVFTLPSEFRGIALQNKKEIYGILFKSVSETLLTIGADPKHLGAKIGFLAILHTWSTTMINHPHIHCIVPGGGISPNGSEWISSRKKYFLPVQVLSALFRKKFVIYLKKSFREKNLSFHGSILQLEDPINFYALVTKAEKKKWVVNSKPPFAGPECVLKYLANYTHRVAISNSRITSVQNGKVTFKYRDRKNPKKNKKMTLDATEFIRRFLLHVLPKQFSKIRYYGLFANRYKKKNIELCKKLIEKNDFSTKTNNENNDFTLKPKTCPKCREGELIRKEVILPRRDLFFYLSLLTPKKYPSPAINKINHQPQYLNSS